MLTTPTLSYYADDVRYWIIRRTLTMPTGMRYWTTILDDSPYAEDADALTFSHYADVVLAVVVAIAARVRRRTTWSS